MSFFSLRIIMDIKFCIFDTRVALLIGGDKGNKISNFQWLKDWGSLCILLSLMSATFYCNELNTVYEKSYSGYPIVWANSTRWFGFSLNSLTVFSLSQL
jgi:hypothetical protein